MKTRTRGLLAAGGVAILSIGLLVFFIARAGPAPRTARGAAPSNIAPPDIRDLPAKPRGPGSEALMGGKGLFVQVVDKKDPTRVASEIISKSFEPLEGQNYLVEEPRAWIYLKNGRIVHVQSKQGRLHMPDRTREPDAGTLQGDVDIKMFDRPAPGRTIDPDKDEPIVRGRTDVLQFDGTLGEVSTPGIDLVRIDGTSTAFQGYGLRLLVNQAQERIELLRFERDGQIKHKPKTASTRKDSTTAPPRADAAKPAPAAADARPSPTEPPKADTRALAQPPAPTPTPTTTAAQPETPPKTIETFYHTVFTGPVVVNYGPRSITDADQLQLWSHLVNNELLPGAIADGSKQKTDASQDKSAEQKPAVAKPAGEPAPAGDSAAPSATTAPPTAPPTAPAIDPVAPATPPTPDKASPLPEPPTASTPDAEEVVITWKGPMEMRPLEARPAELVRDEVALRFTSTSPRPVLAKDAKTDSIMTADSIEYGATSRTVSLTSQKLSSIERPDQGRLSGPQMTIDMAAGLVNVPARGELISSRGGHADASGPSRSLVWNDNAQFQFAVHDGTMTEAITRATMVGSVLGSDRGASLAGDWIQAQFKPDARGKSVLRQLTAKDSVIAKDAKGAQLAAQSLDVTFVPDIKSNDAVPKSLTATGNVRAERQDASIECGSLDASLAKNERDDIIVTQVDARDAVRFARSDGVKAEADELHADAVKQIVDLAGEHAMVGKDADIVYGSQIRLDGTARSLEVFGPGRFEHQSFDALGLPSARADAAWTKGMIFDDLAGTLNASGDIAATNEPDAITIETIRAERIKMRLTPGSVDDSHQVGFGIDSSVKPAPRVNPDAPAAPTSSPTTAASAPATGEGPASPQPQSPAETTAATAAPAVDKPDKPKKDAGQTREVLHAEAFGSDLERDSGTRAKVEMRRYDSPEAKAQGATPQQLQFLESSQIQADNVAGTLTTPGPGKLLVIDRRAPARTAAGAADPTRGTPPAPTAAAPGAVPGLEPSADMSRGDALFDWQGSMVMKRQEGTCHMEKRVKMTHVALGDGAITELECETLDARIRESASETPAVDLTGATRQVNGRLVAADALGAVYIRSQGKELLADGVKYDADLRTVEAWANGANNVTMLDPATAVPVSARRLFWDLARDRIEIRDASPVLAPR